MGGVVRHLSPLTAFIVWVLGGLTDRIDELSLPNNDPKKVFLRETLEKEVRLSYVERIQRTLPEEYACVLPGKPDVEDWESISRTCPKTCFGGLIGRTHRSWRRQ
jgi:MIF4G like